MNGLMISFSNLCSALHFPRHQRFGQWCLFSEKRNHSCSQEIAREREAGTVTKATNSRFKPHRPEVFDAKTRRADTLSQQKELIYFRPKFEIPSQSTESAAGEMVAFRSV